MNDYQPLDLSPFCNVGVSFFRATPQPAIGDTVYWGLPFRVGAKKKNPDRCYIGINGDGGAKEPVTIKIAKKATHLIFAHRLLESDIYSSNGPVGEIVATYIIRFAKSDPIHVPIRDRFEVAGIPAAWGQYPFAAHGDVMPTTMDRKGPFGPGAEAVEVRYQLTRDYTLWAWKNPRPYEKIESITLASGKVTPGEHVHHDHDHGHAHGHDHHHSHDHDDAHPSHSHDSRAAGKPRKFILAAITLSRLGEDPFVRQSRRPVRITLSRPEDAQKRFNLGVGVDRGMATWPHPLPAQGVEEFLNDVMKGWGQEYNTQSSPAYVEVAATPSATLVVQQDGKTIGEANWGDVQRDGKVQTPELTIELIDHGRNWVHTTVFDEETGKPVPCRVHFRSIEGVPYQPHGHHSEARGNLAIGTVGTWLDDIGGDLRLGQASYAYIDGRCQGWLPRGKVIVNVARGFEYEPLRQIVDIHPGQRELKLNIKRNMNMNNEGWYSGDTHVHFLGPGGAHREAAGEDLNVVNLLASQWGHVFTNTEDMIGRPTVSSDGKTIVYCSQENRQHLLGHLSLLGLKEPVMPWCTDGPGEAEMGGNLETTMSDWADRTHAQGGTVVLPHFPNPNGEPATLIATGRVDAIEMFWFEDYCHGEYYRYLNCGYKLPVVGGTDKMTADIPVGVIRTYAYIPDGQPFTYDAWTDALKAGRTFVSSGPMIELRIGESRPGDTLKLPGNGGTIEVEASVRSIFPVHCLQIVQGGKVVASTEETGGARLLHFSAKLKVDKHTWIAARVAGPGYTGKVVHNEGWRRHVFAHTSPIYIAVGGEWWMFDKDTATYMLTLINGSLEHIRTHSLQDEDPSSVTHHHTHRDHEEFLESPFHEAADAIHRRMHQMGIPH